MHASRLVVLTVLCTVSAAACLTGCDEKPATTGGAKSGDAGSMLDKAKDAGGKATAAASDAWKSLRDEAVKSSESALATTKTTLDSAGEKIAKLPEATQAAAKSALEAAKTQYDAAAAKLTELKNADGGTWQTMSTGIKEMITKLGDATKNLTDKLK